ncbi:hypothetical protein MPLSOD_40279 [Mesorhizobium sp. SOD10]|nr:hypothetical protein MPLSOD_40279 [Mesorhizobium sp. SOD10]
MLRHCWLLNIGGWRRGAADGLRGTAFAGLLSEFFGEAGVFDAWVAGTALHHPGAEDKRSDAVAPGAHRKCHASQRFKLR